jgi:1-acyl-sn-glycerol-3-phosphate acyltransferase
MPHELLASGFLGLLAAGLVVVLTVGWCRSRYTLAQLGLLLLAWLLVRGLWRAVLPRRFPVSLGQGAVIVCNHRSSIDPFFIQVCAGRPIHWMVAKEYCEHPLFRWFLRTCEVIPVSRGGVDTAATKTAIRLAQRGDMVGMFPEGRINMSDEFLLPVRPGASLIAQRAQVPIIPCLIRGSPYRNTPWSPLFMPARVHVSFGDAIAPPPPAVGDEQRQAVASESILRVAKALAALAGEADFEPQLAGRHWKPSPAELDPTAADQRSRHWPRN